MKKLYLLLSLLLTLPLYSQNDEFRATWVITWHYIDKNLTVEQNKARIITILENHKKANMNAVLWQVRQSGTTYYQSSYEPWGPYAGDTYPGFDPLQFVIEEAHKRGLEVHAWFNTFHIGSSAADRVVAKHPDWVCTNQSGTAMTKNYCLSPGIEACRDYTVDVAMEVVNNYDVDGLHLDYVRWNEYDETDMKSSVSTMLPDGMISKERLERIESGKSEAGRFLYDQYHPYSSGVPSGFATWGDWRRDAVTQLVRALKDSIIQVKPHVRLSVAALGKYKAGGETGWNGYYVVFQDAAKWFNEGSVDQLTPMHYHWLTGTAMLGAIESDWEPEIQQGITDKRYYSVGPGSYLLESNNCWSNHEGIVADCRTQPWIDGFQFFSYDSWENNNYFEASAGKFFNRMTRVRPYLLFPAPASPEVAITKTDSLHYQLAVTPATANSSWFIIYSSEDNVFDTQADDIIYQTFGNAAFNYDLTFDGLQDYHGQYYYFVTASNRYHNESLPSLVVNTDPIPSLAPAVVSTNPPEGGKVNVNASLQITFSKAMETGTLVTAFQIQPAAPCTFLWSADKKSVTADFTSDLQYDTEYHVTLSSALKDVNGKAIDGNADGTPGDPFVLNFSTNELDSKGPVLIQSTVANNATNVDVSSIISMTFSEEIEPASLNASKITFRNKSNVNIEFDYKLYLSHDKKGVISIRPKTALEPNRTHTLTLSGTVTDTLGNAIGSDIAITFMTSKYYNTTVTPVDEFTAISGWQTPSFSGSTVGILTAATTFAINTTTGLPGITPVSSAKLTYSWDAGAAAWLIREYLNPSGAPALVEFDTTYYVQAFIYGDSSNTKFRFCIDEHNGTAWGDHEVSKWTLIDWRGWKLVEWKLSDPASVGSWISANNQLLGTRYRTDSFQFSRDAGSLLTGSLYIDSYRVVKKAITTVGIEDNFAGMKLLTALPNPFSGQTTLRVNIPEYGKYRITIYNMTGSVADVALEEFLSPGSYDFTLGDDLAAGMYLVELRCGASRQVLRIVKTDR